MTAPTTFRTMRAFTRTMTKWQWVKYYGRQLRTIRTIGGTIGSLKQTHCPITAVTQSATGEIFTPYDYKLAAERLRLPTHLAYDIAQAADDMALRSERLRRILLRAAGLKK